MNNNNKNNGIKANKTQQIKLVDIDVKQAKKDIDEITKYADKKFSELKNKIGNIGFNGGVSPISFASSRSSNSGGSSLAQSANRPAYTGGKTANIGEYFSSSSGLNFGKIASSLNNSAQARYEAKQIESINSMRAFSNEKVYKDTMKNLKPLVQSKELTQEAARKQAQAAVKQEKINNLLSQSADKFSKSGDIMQAGAKIFTAAATTALNLFKAGSDKQTSVYESTYTNVAVRTQVNQSGYRSRQMGINNELSRRGLRDNIRSSDVMQSWSDLADRGLSLKDIDNYSMDDVITKKLVPYLDTMSSSFLAIQNNLGLDFTRNIRGITKSVQDTAGSSRFTVENLNEMITQLEPMSLNAKDDLLSKNVAGLSSFMDSLLQSGQYSTKDIQSLKNNIYDMMYNPENVLMNGNPSLNLAYQKLSEQGITAANDPLMAAKIIAEEQYKLYKNTAGDNSIGSMSDAVAANIIGGSLLGNSTYGFTAGKSNNGLSVINNALNAGSEAKRLMEQNGINVTNTLANEGYDTNKSRQEITMENLTNEYSAIKETLGYWGDIIKAAIDAIGVLITTKVIGGIIGKGMGMIAGSTVAGGTGAGLTGLLGAAGPIALGVGAVVAGVAIGNAINKKALEAAGKENENDKGKQTMEVKGLAEDLGISEGNASLELAGSNIYKSDKNWLGSTFDNYENAKLFGAKLGAFDILDEKDFIQTMDEATKEGDAKKYNKAKIGRSLNYKGIGFTPTVLSNVAKAWMIGLFAQGGDNNSGIYDALKETLGISFTLNEENMVDHMNSSGSLTRSQYESTVDMMSNADMWLKTDSGKWVLPGKGDYDKVLNLNGIEQERKEFLGSHRLGLDYVPYDNYPALLHEGEAVLEQNTANQLRHMISKYEDSEQQSVNFREAIQEQTRELVYRLDSILNILSSASTANMVANEMARIQSPTDENILNMVPVYSR